MNLAFEFPTQYSKFGNIFRYNQNKHSALKSDLISTVIFVSANCSVKTVDGKCCVFPFIYLGKSYSECTNVGAFWSSYWCSTTQNYDVDKQWGHCKRRNVLLLLTYRTIGMRYSYVAFQSRYIQLQTI